MGARTWVCSKSSREVASAAWASAARARRASASSIEMAATASSCSARLASWAATSARAESRSNCALYQRGSMLKSRSPALTIWPAWKLTESMWPETRARSSTVSVASTCPVISSESASSFSSTGATVTGVAGEGAAAAGAAVAEGRRAA